MTAAGDRSARILMLAPEPVLQPRGTPISIFHRLRALSTLGYAVDLVTYPLGDPIDIPGVRVLRVWRPLGLRRIRIGPSAAKVLLDILIAVQALRCLVRHRYAAIHSHEEAVFIAAVYARLFRLPHLYDMHSSLPQQLGNWRKGYAPVIAGVLARLERWAIARSDVLITICPELSRLVRALAPGKPEVMIENAATLDSPVPEESVSALRRQYELNGAPLVVYTGNFEPYQGVDLLLEGVARLRERGCPARLLIVGGSPDDVARTRQWSAARGLGESVAVTGWVRPDDVARYLAAADALVSPRVAGTNTPLKLYAYLKAGKPLVATNLPTHTQVLTEEVAVLVAPEPDALADGLLSVLTNPARAERLGARAKALAEARFGEAAYRARVAEAYQWLLEGRKTEGRQTSCAASQA